MHRILEHRAGYNLGTVEHVHQQRPKQIPNNSYSYSTHMPISQVTGLDAYLQPNLHQNN